MEKITFQDLPSTSTPISATNLNAIQTNVEDVFNGDVPMGSIVVDDISGKNMLNSNIFINAYVSNAGVITNDTKQALFDYIEVESNKTYTVSVKQTIQSIYVVRYDSSKTFIDRVPASTTSSNTFTTTSATKYIIIFINYDNSSTITKSIIDSLDLQLELGDTATTYTPYMQPVKITDLGVKEDTIFYANDFKCRNMANFINFTQTANQDSTYLSIGSVYLEKGTYTLSWTQSATMTSNSRNTPGYYIGSTSEFQTQSTNANMEAGRHSWTFTITAEGVYGFRWWINKPSTTVNMTDFMLEEGSEATPYTPFKQVGEEIYSTNEIKIGTWIDGKPLYRKVFGFNTPSSSTSYTNVATVTNADEVIGIKGYINVGNPRISVNLYADSTNYSTFYYDASSKYIYAKVGSSYTSKPCKLIVEYTKTTD